MEGKLSKIPYKFIVAHVSRNFSLTSRNFMEKAYQKETLCEINTEFSIFSVSKLALVFEIRFFETLKTYFAMSFLSGLSPGGFRRLRKGFLNPA